MLGIHYLLINLYAFGILLLLYINIRRGHDSYLPEEQIFLVLMASNAIILVVDSGMWMLDGQPAVIVHYIDALMALAYYILNPVPCYLWTLYTDYQINRSLARLGKIALPLAIPAVINAVLSLWSLFSGAMFYIDSSNLYHRGPWFMVMAVICYSYLGYAFVQILRSRPRLKKAEFWALLAFAIPPTLGGIAQACVYGLSLIWISMAFSLLIVFINIQNRELYIDHLTGLYNRRQLDLFVGDRMKNPGRKGMLAGIMIDLDGFKNINDRYGHSAGDLGLEHTGRILKLSLRKDDFISRYGGDEFIVFIDVHSVEDLEKAIGRINTNLAEFNSNSGLPYELSFSMGYDIYHHKPGIDLRQFIKNLDQKMYASKKGQADEKR